VILIKRTEKGILCVRLLGSQTTTLATGAGNRTGCKHFPLQTNADIHRLSVGVTQ